MTHKRKSGTRGPETSPEILMLGYLCIKGTEKISERVGILDRFGLGDDDIATICDCAVQSVRNSRLEQPKRQSKKPE